MAAEQNVSETQPLPLLRKLVRRPGFDLLGKRALVIGNLANAALLARIHIDTTAVGQDAAALSAAQERYLQTKGLAKYYHKEVVDNWSLESCEGPYDVVVISDLLHTMPRSAQRSLLAAARARTAWAGYNVVNGYVRGSDGSPPTEAAFVPQPGQLNSHYQMARWQVRSYREIPAEPIVINGQIIDRQANLLAVPPFDHRPIAPLTSEVD